MSDPTPLPPATSSLRPSHKGVLRKEDVRVMGQPALVDCSSNDQGRSLTVVPLMDGDRIAGIEVRCACGAATLIECIYQPENGK